MRKILLIISTVLFVSQIMAQSSRYWVNGAGNWNDSNHWALTSGGTPGATVPDQTNPVVFDQNSPLQKDILVAISESAFCNNFIVTAENVGFKGKAALTITGSVDVVPATDFNKFKGDLVFASSSKVELSLPVDLNSDLIFKNKEGEWILTSTLNTKKDIILESGNLNTNDKAIEANTFLTMGESKRGLKLGKSEITVANWDFTQSNNLNFDAGKSAIIIPKSTEKNVKSVNLQYNAIIPASAGSKSVTITLTPKNATCPLNSIGITNNGEIKADLTGSALYDIVLLDGTLNPIGSALGVPSPYTFKTSNLTPGKELTSGVYSVGYRASGSGSFVTQGTSVGPSDLLVHIQVLQDVSCYGGSDLQLTSVTSGGTAAYTYSWSELFLGDFATTQSTGNIGPGEYQVIVTDNHSCQSADGFAYYVDGSGDYVTGPTDIAISNVSSTNSCPFPSTTGSITVGTVTGGTPDAGKYYYGVGAVPVYGALGVNTISNLASGSYTVWVKDKNNCAKQYGSSVTVGTNTVPAQPSTITGTATPCLGSTQTYSVTNVAGVTYAWALPAGWTGTSTTNSITVTVGATSGNITVTPSNTCGSGTARTLAVTVSDIPLQPSVITGSTTPCKNSSQTYSVTNVAGVTYAWALPAGWTGTSTTNSITVTVGATSGNVTVTPSNGCGTGTARSLAVTVSDVPAQPSVIAGSTTPCNGSSQTYSVTNVAGVTYAWALPAGWTGTSTTNSITVTVGATSGNVTVTPSNGCGNGTARSLAITVSDIPAQPGSISGTATPCLSSSQTYSVVNVAGVTYAWALPAGWTGTSTTNSITVTVGATSGNITVTPSNTCGSGTARTLAVTVSDIPLQPSVITGSTTPCKNSSQTYSVTNVAGVTYAWALPAGWTGTSTTNSITVTVGATSGNVTVTPSNGCGTGTARSLAVTVSDVPAQPSVIAGSTTPCNGSSQTYSVTNVAGVTYAWALPAGWTGTSTTNSITVTVGATSGNVTVTPSNGCGNGTARSLAITVSDIPAQPGSISGTATPCLSSSQTYSVVNVAGVTYAWALPAGWTGTSTTNSITVTVGATSGNITVTPSNTCGSGTARTLAVTVNDIPLQPSVITGSTTPCKNSSQTYSVTNVAGVTYAWALPAGWTGTSTTNSITVTVGATSGNVTVTPSNGCGTGTARSLAVTVSDVPAQPSVIAGSTTPCNGSSQTYSVTNVAGVTYAWALPAGWTGTSTTNSITVTVGATSGNVTVTPSNGCGNGTASTLAVIVNQMPTAFAGIDTTLCSDEISYFISDALASNPAGVSWKNITTNNNAGFSNRFIQNPIYTFQAADAAFNILQLVMTVSAGTCTDITDTLLLIRAPELIASIGGVSPYLINTSTTEIIVSFWATHQNPAHLGFYLLAPDGVTQIRLYQHNLDGTPCSLLAKNTIDSLTFSTNSVADLNFCSIPGSVLKGTFAPAQSWNILNGFDPAQGGWSLVIKDIFATRTGTLTRARITFKDINVNTGLEQEIVFDSKVISLPIKDNATTTYVVPIGLRTNCYGACDARAIVSVTGGKAPYSYAWSTSATNDTVDLCGGDYQVTVTDARGCTSIALVSVLEPDPIIVTMSSTNVKCFGDSTGMVKVIASAGAGGPYKYLWNDGKASTTAQVNNLPAGSYTVTVTDKNMCSTIGTVSITQPLAPITITYHIDSTNCNSATGTITLTPVGGTPFKIGSKYTYAWAHNPLLVGNIATGLAVGTYNVVISDSLGCSLDTTITMVDNGDMAITGFTMINAVSCNSSCDGEVKVNFTGGTGTYNYNWTGAGLTGTKVSLPNVCGDSIYKVTVTDATTSCRTTGNYTVPQPDSLKLQILSKTDVLCFGDSTGKAKVTGTGGTGVYSYVWYTATNDTLSIIDTARNLPFGYTYIEVKDIKNCSYIDSIFINQPTLLMATNDSTPSRCGESTGSVSITPSGGSTPYTYLWDDALATTDSIVLDLAVGIYNVTVTDKHGCQLMESVSVIDTSSMLVVLDSIHNVRCAGSNNGQAFITVSGAVEPFNFKWSNGETTKDATMLAKGIHFVTVTDFNLCSRVVEVTITEPDSLKTVQSVLNEPLCFETNTGKAVVTPNGGTLPYTYLWSDGQTDSIATNLSEGSYTVTVVDANGCDTTAIVTLTDPSQITFNFKFKPTNCGDSIGQINITNLTGGTGIGTYNVSWASPDWTLYPEPDSIGTDTIRNLWVSNYVAIITDGNSCVVRDSMNLPDTSDMSIVLDSIAMISCNGGNNGALLVRGIKGKAPYSYLWDSGDADSLLNDAIVGTYSVQVTDAGQCKRDTAFTLTEPDTLSNNWVFTQPIICHGDTVASLYADISGGVEPYQYRWNNSLGKLMSKDSTLREVSAGWYYLNVVDANSCVYTDSILIFEPNALALTFTSQSTHCPDSTGWAKVHVTGGVAPYTYQWYLQSDPLAYITGQTTDSISNLWVDIFVVEVTDNLGCIITDTIEIADDSGLDFNFDVNHHVWCQGLCDAEAEVTLVTIGINPVVDYTVIWGDNTNGDINSALCLGDQIVTVVENTDGCRRKKAFTITDQDQFKIRLFKEDNISQSETLKLGSVTLRASGGDNSQADKYFVVWQNAKNDTLLNSKGYKIDTLQIVDTISTRGGLDKGWYYASAQNNRNDLVTCAIFDSIYVARDTLRIDSLIKRNELCHGDTNGFIQVFAKGGKPAYNYFWHHDGWTVDSTLSKISNLSVGKYYLTITDKIGSIITDSFEIAQPNRFVANIQIVKTECNINTGSLTIIETGNQGGTPPFEYFWSNPGWTIDSTGISISNLGIDDYLLTSIDSNGCQVDSLVHMYDNSPFNINALINFGTMCFGAQDGKVLVDAQDGTRAYIYDWFESGKVDTISHDSVVSDLYAGWYVVHVEDQNTCKRVDSVEVKQLDKITFEISDTVLNTCYTDSLGSFTFANVLGGSTAGYKYSLLDSLMNPIVQNNPNPAFFDLWVDKYYLSVLDDKGCESDTIPFIFLSKSPQMLHEFKIIDTATCNYFSEDGKMAVTISTGYFNQVSSTLNGAEITYSYRWDDNPALSNDTLINVLAGEHFVRVTDNLECVNIFNSNMPAKRNINVNTFLEPGMFEVGNYYCPNDTLKLYTGILMDAGANIQDSIVWEAWNDGIKVLENIRQDTIYSDTSASLTYVAMAYYKGCAAPDSLFVGRYRIDTLVASVDDNKEKIFVGNEIVLRGNESDVTYSASGPFDFTHSWTWTANNSGVIWAPSPPDTIAPTAKPSINTLFTVYDTIRIVNSNYSNQVCVLSDTLNIIVLPEFDPPAGFTPNGDGFSDKWVLPGIEGYTNVDIQIFDRWGGRIWQHSGSYAGNEWEGTNEKGKSLPSGTYYYIIKYGDDSGTKTLTGPVTILR